MVNSQDYLKREMYTWIRHKDYLKSSKNKILEILDKNLRNMYGEVEGS